MAAPLYLPQALGPGLSGWGAPADSNFQQIGQFLGNGSYPTQIKRAYRDRGSQPGSGETAFPNTGLLGDMAASAYEGHRVWVMDPGGTGWTTTMKDPVDATTDVTHHNQYAFSDGTNWYWEFRPNTLVGGIV